ncbi:MAG: hypothetical protein COB01_11160 [Lutibacter sp.]|nr:MAG: hypothetical protein COB01_11160 [Lutibacter sp.]
MNLNENTTLNLYGFFNSIGIVNSNSNKYTITVNFKLISNLLVFEAITAIAILKVQQIYAQIIT